MDYLVELLMCVGITTGAWLGCKIAFAFAKPRRTRVNLDWVRRGDYFSKKDRRF